MNIHTPQANGWQFGRVMGVPVAARLRMSAVPPQTKAVTIGARHRFERMDALGDQGVFRRGHIVLERCGFAAICYPSAHGYLFGFYLEVSQSSRICRRPALRLSRFVGHPTKAASRTQRITLCKAISTPWCSLSVKIR